jgi:hypothetical protein
MRLSLGHDVKQPVFFVPAARFCARIFASLLRSPQSRVGGAPRDVRVQQHPWGVPSCITDALERAYDAARQAPGEAPCVP